MFVFKKARPAGFESMLDRYISEHSRQPVELLCQVWDAQRSIITYEELNVALLNGFEAQFREWQGDYARFVNGKLTPMWLNAMEAGAMYAAGEGMKLVFDDTEPHVREWIAGHGAELATRLTEQARLAVRNIVLHGQSAGMASEQIAHMIRPLIGLNAPQAAANQRYYERMVAALTRDHPRTPAAKIEEMARQRQLKYAGRQHRYRADTIATTELAFAYNKGQHEGARQAMSRGLMGNCVKVWSTAASERTCPECSALNGQRAKFDEPFEGGHDVPPAHPRCRCTVKYEETGKPSDNPASYPLLQDYGKFPADLPFINGEGYAQQFKNLTGNKVLDESICQTARAMLQHRHGSAIEDGAVFDLRTGRLLLLRTTEQVAHICNLDIANDPRLAAARKAKSMLVAVHTHPGSKPPTDSDYYFLFNHPRVRWNIILGHDGSVFAVFKRDGAKVKITELIEQQMTELRQDYERTKDERRVAEHLRDMARCLQDNAYIIFRERGRK